jgi:hypothetical protein
MSTFKLPNAAGHMEPYRLSGKAIVAATSTASWPRIAYAAAHVVADPVAATDPRGRAAVDWDATMEYRRYLWRLGFRIAEAMDTSQRGMGFDWANARELIRRSLAEARAIPGADLASGAGTDHLAPGSAKTLQDVTAAYLEQVAFVEGQGGRVILMASRELARVARSPDDYLRVYGEILRQCARPVILHWLGQMFDPALGGYWGSRDDAQAAETVLQLINAHASKIEGIKISLLDAGKEIAFRRRLPQGVLMFTGDDFNYPELIEGDAQGYSHALLGIFDAIAPAAAAALSALGRGDQQAYHDIFDPTVPLSRRIFEAPTQYYKAGIVFLAWLNGFQLHFTMLGGMQSARGILHYADIFRLADQAGLLRDTQLAADRMTILLRLHGIA